MLYEKKQNLAYFATEESAKIFFMSLFTLLENSNELETKVLEFHEFFLYLININNETGTLE